MCDQKSTVTSNLGRREDILSMTFPNYEKGSQEPVFQIYNLAHTPSAFFNMSH
jgi:hypothetical protein